MDLNRRLQLYLVGLIIGGGAAYFMMGDRLTNSAWTPEEKVKQRLQSTLLRASAAAEAELATRSIGLGEVRKSMPKASVDLGATRRAGDSIYYAVDTKLNGKDARLVVVALRNFDRDSTATLISIADRPH